MLPRGRSSPGQAACRSDRTAANRLTSDPMAARQEPRVDPSAFPEEFRVAVAQMRAARLRPEVFCEEMPAPQRIAPFASALSADVTVDGEDVGTGRIVLLHDPAGNDAWEGTFRCVAYARAEIDPEMANDPLLAEVGWSWLTRGARPRTAPTYVAPSGTVTKVSSESFGSMADEEPTAQLEIRASWTPVEPRRRRPARPRPARRGVGRAAVHRVRAAAGARGGRADAEPARTARPRLMADQRPRPRRTGGRPGDTEDRRASRRAARARAAARAARRPAAGRRHRGRARRGGRGVRAPAPARSRSTPSGRRATATPPAPTWCSCAARAPAPRWSTRSRSTT